MNKKQIKPIDIKLQILKIQETGCSINTSILPSEDKFEFEKLNVQFGFKNSFNLVEDLFNLSVMVRFHYNINGELVQVLELITENKFKILDLKELIEVSNSAEFKDKYGLLPTLLGISIGTLRGILAVKTAGTILANFPLPLVNPSEIINPPPR